MTFRPPLVDVDAARAHLVTTSRDVECEALGCVLTLGQQNEPDDRPFIERFWGPDELAVTAIFRCSAQQDDHNLQPR